VVNLNKNHMEIVKRAFKSLGIFRMVLPGIIRLNVHCSLPRHNE
jgi:hypothetical protein